MPTTERISQLANEHFGHWSTQHQAFARAIEAECASPPTEVAKPVLTDYRTRDLAADLEAIAATDKNGEILRLAARQLRALLAEAASGVLVSGNYDWKVEP